MYTCGITAPWFLKKLPHGEKFNGGKKSTKLRKVLYSSGFRASKPSLTQTYTTACIQAVGTDVDCGSVNGAQD